MKCRFITEKNHVMHIIGCLKLLVIHEIHVLHSSIKCFKKSRKIDVCKLALNVSKTKFMVFHTINKHVIYPKLKINGNNIERVTNFNFLWLTLSSTLS